MKSSKRPTGWKRWRFSMGRKINLIISDVNMPNLDGIGFVKKAKALASYRFTPVIMLTTETGQSKMAEGKAAGARAWVVKPFQPPRAARCGCQVDSALNRMQRNVMSPESRIVARLELAGEMTIFQVAEQKETLQRALEGNEALEIDLSRVTELDIAGGPADARRSA